MKPRVFIDTGPMAAIFNRRDNNHEWAMGLFRELKPPLLTCDAVLAETFYLLRNEPMAIPFMFGLIEREVIISSFSVGQNARSLKKLMLKYEDTPMDFADACLVRMTELSTECRVWTVDSDFQIYRRNGRASIPLLFPN